MRCLITTVLISALVIAASGFSKQMKEMAINSCKTKVGASDADVQALLSSNLPKTRQGLCMMECLFSAGQFIKNGKFNKQALITAATPSMGGDAARIQKLKKMTDMCEKTLEAKKITDKCELAKEIAVCTHENGKDFGFTFPS